MLGQPETCQSCGYLRAFNPGRAVYYEVNANGRANGNLASHHFLQCWRELADLRGEAEERRIELVGQEAFTPAVPNDSPIYAAHRALLERHRDCGGWYEWKPNLSPKDHYEEQRMLEVEEIRRAHDLKIADLQAESDRRTQQLMEAQHDMLQVQAGIAVSTQLVAEATQRDYRRSDAQNSRHNRWFLALAAMGIILALATLVFPNGAPWIGDLSRDDSPQPVTIVTPVSESTPAPP